MDVSGSDEGPGEGCCKSGNRILGFIKCGDLLDQLSYY